MCKLSQNNIERKCKPFIDKDLQFSSPGLSEDSKIPYNPIYSHYLSKVPVDNMVMPKINETELILAMKEAEQSFESWTKLKRRIEGFKESNQ